MSERSTRVTATVSVDGQHPQEAALADGHRGTDVGNADRLVAVTNGLVRYVPTWRKWLVYDEGAGVWRIDEGDALITEQAKLVPRTMFRIAAGLSGGDRDDLWNWARRTESASSIAAMIRMARGIPGVHLDHTELDQHPWLLNVLNGTIDLQTGLLMPHDPDHLLTKQAPVMYDPQATAPLWAACLNEWQPDPDVRGYLQRIVGSAATGVPVEYLFVNVGGGANGKGKFYGAITGVLGPEYFVVPHKSLLVAQRHEQHDTVKARLAGARMAIAGETGAGDRLDEAKIKELTGGDLLEARRMKEDPWQFAPSHTLILHTNHRPRISGVDEGIWRRIRLIPWDVTIPGPRRDEGLPAKLEAEAPGILNWIIQGAQDFHAHGFQEPGVITAATEGYRTDEDQVGRFLHACCVIDPSASVTAKDLRLAYERWCAGVGEAQQSAQAVGAQLGARGYESRQKGKDRARTWIGLGLRPAQPPKLMR